MAKKAKFELTKESVETTIARMKLLNPKEMKAVNKQTMRKAGTALKQETARRIKQVISNANAPSARHPGMTPPAKGVRVYVYRSGEWVKVSIYNKSSFLLSIFEKGSVKRYINGEHTWKHTKTRRRYTRRAYRGSIKALRFFEAATEATNARAKEIITTETVKAINRQWAKKKS